MIQRFIRIIILPQVYRHEKSGICHKKMYRVCIPLIGELGVSPGTRKCIKTVRSSGSGVPEHQIPVFLINHDLLVFIHFSFEDHF